MTSDHEAPAPHANTGDGDDWRVNTVPLGGSPLSLALQRDPALHEWLAVRPDSADAWCKRIATVYAQSRDRDWLSPLAPAIAATGRAAARLARAAEHGVVVTTGQQPGLFGGPTYTWSKALSCLAMADALEAASGVAVAPVFWAATDDSDWVEASVTHLASSRGLHTVRLEGPPTDGIAMADLPLGPMDSALTALRSACGSGAHGSFMQVIEHAYVPHATVGAAYVQLLRALLEPLGMAVLDASHPALRAAADPIVRRALHRAPLVSDTLAARTQAISAAGFATQVDLVADLSLVFRTQSAASGRERDRMRARVSVADASRAAREADVGTLGANVLLRPVVERALLPTVAYMAGPGEYAYFAQIGPIAQALEVDVPLAVPRWAGEIVDGKVDRLRESLGLSMDMLRDPHAAESIVARRAIDPDVADGIERLRVALETQARAVGDAAARADDLVAPEVVTGLSRDLLLRLTRFERRVTAAVKRRERGLLDDVSSVRAWMRPDGTSPERRLNIVPMLARFGPNVFTVMLQQAYEYGARIVRGG